MFQIVLSFISFEGYRNVVEKIILLLYLLMKKNVGIFFNIQNHKRFFFEKGICYFQVTQNETKQILDQYSSRSGYVPMTSPFTFPPSVSFPMERFKFFIPPSYIFPPPFPPHYFGSTLFRPMQFPQFNALNNRKLLISFLKCTILLRIHAVITTVDVCSFHLYLTIFYDKIFK